MPISYKHKIYIPAPDIQNVNMRTEHPVKSQISVNYKGTNIAFDVLDYDKHTLVDTDTTKSMCVGSHNIISYGTIPFCAPQLMYYTEGGLPAGNYKFTLDHAVYGSGTQYDGTYMFTITQAIPADGGFRHTNIGGYKASYAQGDVIGNYITTYGVRPQRAEVEKKVAVNLWDGTTACADLGTFTARNLTYYTEVDTANGGKRNFTERNYYGSNRWRDCVYRQWLNSDAGAVSSSDTTTISNWWKPATVFDRVPGGAKLAGFLNGLDPEFVEVLGEIEVKTALCVSDKVDGTTYDITHDRVWLQSMTEIFGSNNNGISEGSQLAYWVGASNADRIKYEGSTASYWWLRSTYPTYASNVRSVYPSGTLNSNTAYNSNGVVPTFCIKQYDGGIKPVVSYKRKLYMGRSIEWNQLLDKSKFRATVTSRGITVRNNGDGTFTINGTKEEGGGTTWIWFYNSTENVSLAKKLYGHKILYGCVQNPSSGSTNNTWGIDYEINGNMTKGAYTRSNLGESAVIATLNKVAASDITTAEFHFYFRPSSSGPAVYKDVVVRPQLFDLTQMFGAGNEPATPAEFWSYFDHKLYPYNPGETQPLFKISRKSQWGSGLPTGYRKCQFLQGAGDITTYFVIPQIDITNRPYVLLECMYQTYTMDINPFGSIVNGIRFEQGIGWTGNGFSYNYGNGYGLTYNSIPNAQTIDGPVRASSLAGKRLLFEYKNDTFFMDGVEQTIARENKYADGQFGVAKDVYLFGTNRGTTKRYFDGKIYRFYVENQIDLIPAIDPSGVPCMYDLISRQPLYNQGTGEFLYELA